MIVLKIIFWILIALLLLLILAFAFLGALIFIAFMAKVKNEQYEWWDD